MSGKRGGMVTVISFNQLNSSPAKMQYSFSKEPRFEAKVRNSYCPEAFYRGSAQEFKTIGSRATEARRLRNVQSFSSFGTTERWNERSGGPGPAEYHMDSVFKKASESKLHPIFSRAVTDFR